MRFLVVILLGALVVASGKLLATVGVRAAPEAGGPAVPTGAWFCPHGGAKGWSGWMVVANPGSSSVRVRLTTFHGTGDPVVQSFAVGPLQEAYREVAVDDPASATEVEYFGGWVGAAAVLRSSGSRVDVAAERCVAGLRSSWLMPDETTAPNEDAALIVMNPYAAPAEFDVRIRTNKRTIEPGELKPVVLPAGSSTSMLLDTWALEGPDEDTVTAQVVPRLGRVIAGSLVTSTLGVRAEAGIPVTGDRWFVPAAGYSGTGRLIVMNPGPGRPALSVLAQGDSAQTLVAGLTGLSPAPSTSTTFEFGAVSGASASVESTNGAPFAVGMRLAGPNGGTATIVGVSKAANGWLVLPMLPPTGGSARLVLQNPGHKAVTVSVRLLGPDGPVAGAKLGALTVGAGRQLVVTLPLAGDTPLSAVVTVRSGAVVAAGYSISVSQQAYAATNGIPLP